jgi:hypothetical protein
VRTDVGSYHPLIPFWYNRGRERSGEISCAGDTFKTNPRITTSSITKKSEDIQ